jgi:hypothetical protein
VVVSKAYSDLRHECHKGRVSTKVKETITLSQLPKSVEAYRIDSTGASRITNTEVGYCPNNRGRKTNIENNVLQKTHDRD